ncbi:hypothetical protein [Bradyrhizobium sp. USDA 10063]
MRSNFLRLAKQFIDVGLAIADMDALRGIVEKLRGLLEVFQPSNAFLGFDGELWQIGFGNPGEQLFSLPEFDGKTNLTGHQTRNGIFREYPGLMAITFAHPRWNQKSELLTLWNVGFDQTVLKNPCGLSESDIDDLLYKFSDGVNDPSNERGWHFRIIPLRP